MSMQACPESKTFSLEEDEIDDGDTLLVRKRKRKRKRAHSLLLVIRE